jgi:5-methylcytosine-specific restriction protein A
MLMRFLKRLGSISIKDYTMIKIVTRQTAHERGYTAEWQKARIIYLRANPLCADCYKIGRLNAATVVDHIKAHKGDTLLFWDQDNWQPLCKACHDRKTAREDGGMGNKQGKGKARADCGVDGLPVDRTHHWNKGDAR